MFDVLENIKEINVSRAQRAGGKIRDQDHNWEPDGTWPCSH